MRHFFEGTDVVSEMQPQFYPVTYQQVTHVYHRGASCCRYYRLRQGHYCASCPLSPTKNESNDSGLDETSDRTSVNFNH